MKFTSILRAKLKKLPDDSKLHGRVFDKCLSDFSARIKGNYSNNGQDWAIHVGTDIAMFDYPGLGMKRGYMIFEDKEI